jgi:hypothetical protein
MLDAKKRLQEINDKNEASKRTTIILDRDEREFIDSLIKQGKEAGIKPLISKMLNIYKCLTIHSWRFPGEYYCGISRVAFINEELVNIAAKNIPKENWRGVGKSMGQALKVSLEASLGIQTPKQENWEAVFNRLRIQGFGEFQLKDKYLLIKNPFFEEASIWEGLLEGLLGVKLETRNSVPPLVFELKTSDA